MIKKFKRWYGNLLDFQKQKIFSLCLAIFVYILLIILNFLKIFNNTFYASYNYSIIGFLNDCFLFFIWFPVGIYTIFRIVFHLDKKEDDYNLRKSYEDAEKEIKGYFYTAKSNILEVVPKNLDTIADIIEYYNQNGKVVESYWIDLDENSEENAICHIYAIYYGETEKVVYPETIRSFMYLKNRFRFKVEKE